MHNFIKWAGQIVKKYMSIQMNEFKNKKMKLSVPYQIWIILINSVEVWIKEIAVEIIN
jgi:hypothetical protein